MTLLMGKADLGSRVGRPVTSLPIKSDCVVLMLGLDAG